MRLNMINLCHTAINSSHDIEYTGSGGAAKALDHCTTDHVAKSGLLVYAAFAASQAAAEKLEDGSASMQSL